MCYVCIFSELGDSADGPNIILALWSSRKVVRTNSASTVGSSLLLPNDSIYVIAYVNQAVQSSQRRKSAVSESSIIMP